MLLLIKGYPWVAHFHKMNFDNFLLNVCLTLAFDLKGKMEVGPKYKWKWYRQFGAAKSLYLRTSVFFYSRPSPGIFNLACSPLLVVSLEGLLYFLWMMDVSKKRPPLPHPQFNLTEVKPANQEVLPGDVKGILWSAAASFEIEIE